MSQKQQILDWLKSGKTLTSLEALNQFGCFRLGARIYELNKEGHGIECYINQGKKKFAVYYIAKENLW